MLETLKKAIENLMSTKFFIALYTGALATWQFNSTQKSTADWVAYLGFLTAIATGHGVTRVMEKKNQNKNNK